MKRLIVVLAMLAVVPCAFLYGAIDLKEDTATTVYVGPFFDITTGVDQEKALTVTGWEVKIVRTNGDVNTLTITASAGDNDAVHVQSGRYSLELTSGDVNQPGFLIVDINDVNAIPVWHEYNILPANIYDSKYSTDKLQVDVNQVDQTNLPITIATFASDISQSPTNLSALHISAAGNVMADVNMISANETAATNAQSFFDGTGYAGTNNTIPTVTTLTGHTAQTGDTYALANGATGFAAIDTVVDAILVDTAAQDTAGEWTTLGAGIGGSSSSSILTTTVATGTDGYEFTVAATGVVENNAYAGCVVTVADADGDNVAELGVIRKWTASTKTIILQSGLSFTPAAGDVVNIYPTNPLILSIYNDIQGAF